MRRRRALALLGFCWSLGLQAAAGAPEAPPQEEEETAAPQAVVAGRLTVTATRLRDDPVAVLKIPANVTVISADRIARSGASTLQDLLRAEAGIVLYDQTGNDVSKTLDLRGFTDGTGTRVYLDGTPLNNSRNNGLALEMVSLESLDRVEITRGSAAALGGGGSEAGIINLWSRRGEPLTGSLAVAAGDFGTEEYRGNLRHAVGRFDLSLAGSWYSTDGFRANADGDLGRFAGAVGYDLGGDRRLSVSVTDGSSDFGTPGALTASEFEEDAAQAPFNRLDFSDESQTQGTLAYQGSIAGPLSLAANLFYRDRSSAILSTGRSAPIFGGFYLDASEAVVGSTLQVGHRVVSGRNANEVHLGLEWLDGDTEAAGFFTAPGDPGTWDPANPSSVNTVQRTTTAAFVQDALSVSSTWTLSAGLRYDRDEIGYREFRPDPTLTDSLRTSEVSLRAGATWTPRETHALWISYGEGFLPPTAEQLFSFPLFGSNPDLEPEDSSSWELGFRRHWEGPLEIDMALFRIDTRNEIIFDPNSPLGLFGANVNAGETRRQGLEASFRGSVLSGLEVFANLTLIGAEFLAGADRGNRVPLVPGERAGLGFEVVLPADLRLRAEGLHVGEQVLDNDEANSQPKLAAYTVVDARLTWAPSAWQTGAAGDGLGFEVFVEARNLLDERYATRGIYAFDFSTFSDEVFFTPAPGRRLLGGVKWRF